MQKPRTNAPSHESDLRNLISFRLRQLTNLYTKGSSSVYERSFDLTLNEWRCIALLQNQAGLSLNRLAEHAQFDRGLTSRTITALEQRGYVSRQQDSTDGRGIVLTLTAEGRKLVTKVFPVAEQLNERLLSVLTRSEREMLPQILDKLTHQARVMLDQERENASDSGNE